MKATDIKHMHPKAAPDAPAVPNISDETPDEAARLDLIAEVHTRVADAVKGYDKLVAKADTKLRPAAQELLDMHQSHEKELARYLAEAGRDPAKDGTFFATVNRVAIEVRSWFDVISENVIEQIKEGEKHVLDAYYAAQKQTQPADADAMLARHVAEVDALMTRLAA
ncbi:MAG: DUF2383 domain-containing protein [Rhodobacteraceae bacterium]|nr:DUF2383 domain-containing protein [Paracoccaceae bacterium]